MKCGPLGTLFMIPLLACSEDGVSPPNIPDIDGSWTYSETTIENQGAKSCSTFGTLSFAQERETFVGSYTRTASCASSDNGGADTPAVRTESGQVSQGQLTKETVRFDLARCEYRGLLSGSPANRAAGTVLCIHVSNAGTATTSSGTWQADRLTPTGDG